MGNITFKIIRIKKILAESGRLVASFILQMITASNKLV